MPPGLLDGVLSQIEFAALNSIAGDLSSVYFLYTKKGNSYEGTV